MKIFESFKKGVNKANMDINNLQESIKFDFVEMKNQILDKTIDDATVAINIKKFLKESVDPKEIGEITDLFILNRQEAVNLILEKK